MMTMSWEDLTKEQRQSWIRIYRASKGQVYGDGGHKEVNDATYVQRPPVYKPINFQRTFNDAWKRSPQPYSNYSDALDNPFSPFKEWGLNALRWVKDNFISGFPSGVSNCTLSATQWVNPSIPVKSAASIIGNPSKYHYARIDSADTLPGNLLIAKVPHKDSYHTMMITGFVKKNGNFKFKGKNYKVHKGEPLLTYSKGGNTSGNIQTDIPLSVYTKNSDGHTENMFFRYNDPYNILLPEVTIKAKRK